MEDAQLVAMKTVVSIDPTVAEVADLLPGWSAERTSVGGEWSRTQDEWDASEE